MILKRILELSQRLEQSLPPPGCQPAFMTKKIRLRYDGSIMDVVPVSGQKKGKQEGKHYVVPREMPRRSSNAVPRLIHDNPSYVLGRARQQDKAEVVQQRHHAYAKLVRECAEATAEPSVQAVARWLERGGAEQLRDDPRIADNDELLIEVDGIIPTDLPSVRDFWLSRTSETEEGMCLVTGQSGPVVTRLPALIKGIPGALTTGAALVAVNNPCGESYGLTAALNSPIGATVAQKIVDTLNCLLASERHSLRIANTVFVYWTREDVTFDPWKVLRSPDPGEVARLIESVSRGGALPGTRVSDFYALCLGANVSRVVIHDYIETTLESVQIALGRWFASLQIIGHDGDLAQPPGLFRLAASLYFKPADIPPDVPAVLMRCALTGSPIPDHFLSLAVRRNAAEQGPFESGSAGGRYVSEPRIALIKAVLSQKEVSNLAELNANHPDPAYHCGRLLAVLERIQRAALGEINATVVDRYYGAASASPAAVLGRLLNNAQSHLSKLRKEGKDFYVQRQLEEVLAAIGSEFPRTLSLHRQGLFALGYYHQRVADRRDASAAKAAKREAEGSKSSESNPPPLFDPSRTNSDQDTEL